MDRPCGEWHCDPDRPLVIALGGLAVVIPTRNRAELLRRAVASVEDRAEVVVVDDGSTDQTPDVGRELAERGVTYLRLEGRNGPGHARNVGVAAVRSELILFLDDDDAVLPGGVERIVAVADSHPDHDLYLHNCRHADGHTTIDPELPPTAVTFDDWLVGRFQGELKPVARRALFERHQYEDTGSSGEGLLWARVIRESGAIADGTPVVLYDDVAGEDRLTSVTQRLARAGENARVAEQILTELGPDLLRLDPPRWGERWRAAVVYNVLAGRRGRARGLLRIAPEGAVSPRTRMVTVIFAYTPRRLLQVSFWLAGRGSSRRSAG